MLYDMLDDARTGKTQTHNRIEEVMLAQSTNGKIASGKAVLAVHDARLVRQAVVTDSRLRRRWNVTFTKTDGAQ